jgi:hypothetical protein
MTVHEEIGQSGGNDPLLRAIDDASDAIEDNLTEERMLLGELDRLRQDRIAGKPLREALGEGRPRALGLANSVMVRTASISARLQRSFSSTLNREGDSVTAIARRFGVTHQRISALISRNGRREPEPPLEARI